MGVGVGVGVGLEFTVVPPPAVLEPLPMEVVIGLDSI